MGRTSLIFCSLALQIWGAAGTALAAPRPSVLISEATFTPQYGPGGSKLPVKITKFSLDRTPVTRAEFSEFVKKNPTWLKGRVVQGLAEPDYLKQWIGAAPPPGTAGYPVVQVSYFSAAAFCEWSGGRLPTLLEWEYVASAGHRTAEGISEPGQLDEWIGLYSSPSPNHNVGRSPPNFHGVSDLHGLIWEWTLDYNSAFVTADNREDGELSKNLFCGSGSMSAADRSNYPAFLRYAMRGGLRPNYTIANLGFRCAYDTH